MYAAEVSTTMAKSPKPATITNSVRATDASVAVTDLGWRDHFFAFGGECRCGLAGSVSELMPLDALCLASPVV